MSALSRPLARLLEKPWLWAFVGAALVWLATEAAADLAGEEVSLRDPEIRARIGLPPAAPR